MDCDSCIFAIIYHLVFTSIFIQLLFSVRLNCPYFQMFYSFPSDEILIVFLVIKLFSLASKMFDFF